MVKFCMKQQGLTMTGINPKHLEIKMYAINDLVSSLRHEVDLLNAEINAIKTLIKEKRDNV